MNNSFKMLFFFILIMSSLITISANSWISAWIGLEINLLSFIPLMKDNKNNLLSSEASLKYFLVQALASTVFLSSIILFMLQFNFMNELKNQICASLILISLLMKSGVAPLHFWFPNIMEGLTWMNSFILMTWQKIAPMILISYMIMNQIIFLSIILSSIIGSIGGLNQTSLRKLMAFSSINHLSWMLISMIMESNLWIMYFLFYSFLTMIIIYLFNLYKMYHIYQLFNLFMISKMFKFCLFLNLLSLGGLPPFLGFLPKWIVIQYLIMADNFFLIFLLIITTLITLFFYIRMCYSTFLLNNYEMNNNYLITLKPNAMMILFISSFWSLLGFFLIYTFFII